MNAIVSFLLVAFSIFLFVKAVNRFTKKIKEEAASPAVNAQEELLKEIRDLLKEKKS